MSSPYCIAPNAAYWDADMGRHIHAPVTLTVVEPEPGLTRTGLLDAMGRPLFRAPERVPCGFQPRVKC